MRRVLSTALLVLATSSFAGQFSPHFGRTLESTANGKFDAIITLKEQADLKSSFLFKGKKSRTAFVFSELKKTAQKTQANLLTYLKKNNIQHRSYYITNMISVNKASLAQLKELVKFKEVDLISTDNKFLVESPLKTPALAEEPSFGIAPNIQHTKAPQVWEEFANRGEGIVVAGQDTGIEWDHPALKNKYRGFNAEDGTVDHNYSWHDAIHGSGNNRCGYDTEAPCDDNGHGTHTVGTMLGEDDQQTVGMAPDAKWIGCRNMDAGWGKPSSYIECFEYFLAPWPYGADPQRDGEPRMSADIINNSWGCPPSEGCEPGVFVPTLQAMRAAGIMVVVSAGNSGPNCATIQDPPATHSELTFTVGAMNHRNNSIANFSSRGPSTFDGSVGPDLSAPGVQINSTIPGGGYSGPWWSGTSMAGPHVAGAIALLWSIHPGLYGDIDMTTLALNGHAIPTMTTQTCQGRDGALIPNNTFGHGILDIHGTIASLKR